MTTRAILPMLLLLPALSGCAHWGEADYLGFQFTDFADLLYEFQSGDQLLLCARVCPRIDQERTASGEVKGLVGGQGEELRACFSESVSGPAMLDADGCLVMTGPGEVSWELTPSGCGEHSERMRWMLVEPRSELALGFDEWRVRLGLEIDPEPAGLAQGRHASELGDPPDAPRRVYAGAVDVPLLRLDDANGQVFWMASDVTFELVGSGAEIVEPDPNNVHEHGGLREWVDPAEVALRLDIGALAHVEASLPSGETLESPQLLGVGPDAVASLDLMAVDGYLFADVRDGQGRRIYAAPIEWSVTEGALELTPGSLETLMRTSDFAEFSHGDCLARPTDEPEIRHATVAVSLGELSDSVEVSFVVEPTMADSLWPSEDCMYGEGVEPPGSGDEGGGDETGGADGIGCGCTSEPQAPGAPVLAVFGLLGLLRWRHQGADSRRN